MTDLKVPLHGRPHSLNGSDPIPPGKWHYVGETDEPDFENDWANGDDPVRFRLTNENTLEVDGMPTGGSAMTSVFTLPTTFRPATDKEPPIPIIVTAAGEVIVIDIVDGGSP